MENYSKGKNVENELQLSDVPIRNIPQDIVWMKVRPGSKMSNLIGFGLESFKTSKLQLWSGIGPAVGKTISSVEILKKHCQNLHQVTKVAYHKCEEYWEPKIDGLDPLKIVRQVPVIHILLSSDPLDPNELGYQAPNKQDAFWKGDEQRSNDNKRRNSGSNMIKKPFNNGQRKANPKTKKT